MAKWLIVALFAILAVGVLGGLQPEDLEAVTDIYQILRPVGWTAANIANLCDCTSCEGKVCESYNGTRYIKTLALHPDNTNILPGTRNIPPSIFLMPYLEVLQLRRLGLSGAIPANITSPLTTLDLRGNNLRGCWRPDPINPSTLRSCNLLENTGLTCSTSCIPRRCTCGQPAPPPLEGGVIAAIVIGSIAGVWLILGIIIGITTGNWWPLLICLICFGGRRR